MDDRFAYRSAVPIRRQVDPRLVKTGITALVVLVAIGLFAGWVISSERRSFARTRSAEPASPPSTERTDAAALDPGIGGADVDEALRLAADAAWAAFTTDGSFVAATPARLGELQPGYTFVDGPSTAAGVVSVASSEDAFAGAVLGPDGVCAWTTVSTDGTVARAAGDACTGAAALAAIPPS